MASFKGEIRTLYAETKNNQATEHAEKLKSFREKVKEHVRKNRRLAFKHYCSDREEMYLIRDFLDKEGIQYTLLATDIEFPRICIKPTEWI